MVAARLLMLDFEQKLEKNMRRCHIECFYDKLAYLTEQGLSLIHILDRFDGIIIIVSHDRYFLDRTVNRIFSFEGDGVIRQFEGGYSDYLIRKELEALPEETAVSGEIKECNTKNAWKKREKKLKFSFKEQREFETIDDEIAALEDKIEELNSQVAANATNSARLNELLGEKEEMEQKLEEKMERWVYLNDLKMCIRDSGCNGRRL